MCSVSIIPVNKRSLQELNQLMGIKLLTSGFLNILVISPISRGGNTRFAPLPPLRTPMLVITVGPTSFFYSNTHPLKHSFPFILLAAFFRMLNYYASILFLMVMSIDRYLAINHAMNARLSKFRLRKAVYMISMAVWTMGLLCVVFVMIHAQVEGCKCKLIFGRGKTQPLVYYRKC